MIRDLLLNKSPQEKTIIRGQEIAKLDHRGIFVSPQHNSKVEILSLNAITGGVELFAQAWKNGRPLGFGKDGTTEIERFKIINPPFLVFDPNGSVIREWVDDITGELKRRTVREDPIEAIRQSLAHTIKLVGKENSPIIKGKIGNTTSIFYPAIGTGGDSVDGNIFRSNEANWAAARDAATGTVTNDGVYENCLASKITASDWRVYRNFFTWPTATIPDTDTIDSATASFFHTTDSLVDADGSNIYLVSNAQFSATALQADDFVDLGATNLATAALDITGMTNAYQDMAIASGNLGQINKTAPTKLGLRVQMDVDNTEPTGNNAASFAMADGTAGDPKLTVVHSAVAINEAAWARSQEMPIGFFEKIRTIPY